MYDPQILDTGSDVQAPCSTYQHPFNDDDADCIVRSQDGVDFRVHRFMLSRASDVFADMFPIPRGFCDASLDTQLPVVTVLEECEPLDFLFRCIYHFDIPKFQILEVVQLLLDASIKYHVKKAVQLVEKILSRLAKAMPMRVYAFACQYRLSTVARAAARQSLDLPMHCLPCVPEFDRITGTQLHALFAYHSACRDAAVAVVTEFEWMAPDSEWHLMTTRSNCKSNDCYHSGIIYLKGHAIGWPTSWFMHFVEQLRSRFKDLCRAQTSNNMDLLLRITSTEGCSVCKSFMGKELIKFYQMVNKEIEDRRSEVVLKVGF